MAETETVERTQRGGFTSGSGAAFAEGLVVNSPVNGRLVATGELTEMQEAFCLNYVLNGGNGQRAAEAAGYASEPRQVAFYNLKNSKVRARIQEIVQQRVDTFGAVIGYTVLIEIAQDPTAPPGVRRHCAKDLLELAGFYKDRPADGMNPRKSLAEMTREELEAVVAQGAAVLTAASKLGPVLNGRLAQDKARVSDAETIQALPDSA